MQTLPNPCTKYQMAALSAGDKYNFVSEPNDAFKCLICLEVAEEPWQHDKCGKLFCKECLDRHGTLKPCPNCRAEQPQYFLDTRGKYASHNHIYFGRKQSGLIQLVIISRMLY